MAHQLNPWDGHVALVVHLDLTLEGARTHEDATADCMIEPHRSTLVEARLGDRPDAHHLDALSACVGGRVPRPPVHKETGTPHQVLWPPCPRGNASGPGGKARREWQAHSETDKRSRRVKRCR